MHHGNSLIRQEQFSNPNANIKSIPICIQIKTDWGELSYLLVSTSRVKVRRVAILGEGRWLYRNGVHGDLLGCCWCSMSWPECCFFSSFFPPYAMFLEYKTHVCRPLDYYKLNSQKSEIEHYKHPPENVLCTPSIYSLLIPPKSSSRPAFNSGHWLLLFIVVQPKWGPPNTMVPFT